MRWMKNTEGQPDAILTMAFIGFVIVMIKIIVGGASISFGDLSVSAGDVDAMTVAAVLTPTLGAYVARRYSEAKFDPETIAASASVNASIDRRPSPAPVGNAKGGFDVPVR